MHDRMNCNQRNHAKRASKAYQIIGFTEDGHVIIDVLKDRQSGVLGRMVVPAAVLLNQIIIK